MSFSFNWITKVIQSNCIFIAEVVEPPLNIYCYLDDKMYVKVPMTLKITIKNPSRTAMRLKTCLKNSESFMFSGNTQVRDIFCLYT